MSSFKWKFQHPFTARFVGPTACGKTSLIVKIIKMKLIHPFPTRIIYFYGSSWQNDTFDELQSKYGVKFFNGFNEEYAAENIDMEPTLIICDDLILEMKDSEAAANLFMRGSHHLNLSVILIEQSLFPKGKQSVSMKQNTHYFVIFKSPSDSLGVTTLARQMFSSRSKFLVESFHDCTKNPHSYLIIDCKQSTPDEMRLITGITSSKNFPTVYVQNAKEIEKNIKKFNENQFTKEH